MMPDGYGQLPPLHRLTPDDKGAIVIIVAYCWIFISTIIAIIRFGIAWNQRLRFKLDDATFSLGFVSAIASSVAFHLAANVGLGKHITKLSEDDLNKYYRRMYAGELLGIISMAGAKASAILLSDRVAPRRRMTYNLMLGIIAIWTIFSIFSIAFQCPLPHPWVYVPSTCPSHGNLQYPIITFNILTDAILATWILPTLWKLLMDMERRILVVSLFGSRIFVSMTAIGQLAAVSQSIRKEDQTWASFGRVVWEITTIHLSVLLSTLPRTNRFLSSLHSGQLQTRVTDYELSQSATQQLSVHISVLPKVSGGSVDEDTQVTGGTELSETFPPSRTKSHGQDSTAPILGNPIELITFDDRVRPSVQSHLEAKGKVSKTKSVEEWRDDVRLSMKSKNDGEDKATNLLDTTVMDDVITESESSQQAVTARRSIAMQK